jgi:hypothetical protein
MLLHPYESYIGAARTRPPRPLLPHASVLHLHAVAAATSTRPPRPEAEDLYGCTHDTSTFTAAVAARMHPPADAAIAARTRPPRQRRRCRRPASSMSTPPLPHAGVLHLHGGAAGATRRRPPPPGSLLPHAPVLHLHGRRRCCNSRLLWTKCDPCGNNQVRYCPSFTFKTMSAFLFHHQGIQLKTEKKMSVSSQMYWMQMFTYSVICRLPAYYSIRGSN